LDARYDNVLNAVGLTELIIESVGREDWLGDSLTVADQLYSGVFDCVKCAELLVLNHGDEEYEYLGVAE
jgi:hypothetical protein